MDIWDRSFGEFAGGEFSISQEDIEIIQAHLSRPELLGHDGKLAPENVAMIKRLQAALTEERKISGPDACFYFHELYECVLMNKGLSPAEAHRQTLDRYKISPFNLYHPDVIKSMPQQFNSKFLTFWEIQNVPTHTLPLQSIQAPYLPQQVLDDPLHPPADKEDILSTNTQNPTANPPNTKSSSIAPSTSPLSPQRRWKFRILIIISILLIIGGSSTIYYSYYTAQQNQLHAQATSTSIAFDQTQQSGFMNATATAYANDTATAQSIDATNQANDDATATAQAYDNATATAVANAAATATIIAENPDPYPFTNGGGTLAVYDPLSDNSQGNNWDENAGCTFTNGGYQVSASQPSAFSPCAMHRMTFSNFVFEVQMTIVNGDEGGIFFRSNSSEYSLYYFYIKADQSYAVGIFNGSTFIRSLTELIYGYNQPNTIAVTAVGNLLGFYVDRQLVFGVNDNTLTQGLIGVYAKDETNPTEVVFSNARVWTL